MQSSVSLWRLTLYARSNRLVRARMAHSRIDAGVLDAALAEIGLQQHAMSQSDSCIKESTTKAVHGMKPTNVAGCSMVSQACRHKTACISAGIPDVVDWSFITLALRRPHGHEQAHD